MRALLPLVLLLAAALPAVPPAAAQASWACGGAGLVCQTSTTLWMQPQQAPVPTDGPLVAIPVQVDYQYTSLVPEFTPTQVDLRVVAAPPWAVVTLSPSTVYIPLQSFACLCPASGSAHAMALVSVTPEAPAFTADIIVVQAFAHENGLHTSSSASNAVPIQADYFAMTEARLAETEVALAGRAAREVPMTLTSFANGPTRFTFEVASAPLGVQVAAPSPVVLESKQAGGERTSTSVVWRLRATGDADAGPVTLLVRSAYALDPALKGDETTLTFHVQPSGGAGDVVTQGLLGTEAGPSPLMLGLVFAGIAMAALQARKRLRQP